MLLPITTMRSVSKSLALRRKNSIRKVTHISNIPIIHHGRKTFLLPPSLLCLPLFEPLLHLCATRGYVSASCQTCILDSGRTHLFSLPTLTVAIILRSGPGKLSAKHDNSKNEECSEYGTPEKFSIGSIALWCTIRITPLTIHHVLPATAPHRLQTRISKPPGLIPPNDQIDIRHHVRPSRGRVTPTSRSESQYTVEMGM